MQYESLPHAFQGPSAKRIGGDASGFISGVGILADRNAINAVPVSSVHQDVGARGVLRCRGCPSAIRAAFRFALRLALSPARGVDDACRDTAGLADTGLVRRSYPFGRCGVIWKPLPMAYEPERGFVFPTGYEPEAGLSDRSSTHGDRHERCETRYPRAAPGVPGRGR